MLIEYGIAKSQIEISLNYDACLSLKIVFIFANSSDPDEIVPYVAFHMGSTLFA